MPSSLRLPRDPSVRFCASSFGRSFLSCVSGRPCSRARVLRLVAAALVRWPDAVVVRSRRCVEVFVPSASGCCGILVCW